MDFAINSLYITIGGFVVFFGFKALQDPNFCRSEKHIETVKRIELTQQKGEPSPRLLDVESTSVTTNPEPPKLPSPPQRDSP